MYLFIFVHSSIYLFLIFLFCLFSYSFIYFGGYTGLGLPLAGMAALISMTCTASASLRKSLLWAFCLSVVKQHLLGDGMGCTGHTSALHTLLYPSAPVCSAGCHFSAARTCRYAARSCCVQAPMCSWQCAHSLSATQAGSGALWSLTRTRLRRCASGGRSTQLV